MGRLLSLLAAVAFLASACGGHARPLTISRVSLPPNHSPVELALGSDDSLWMTDQYGGISQLAHGDLAYDVSEETMEHVVRGPDGAMWFAGYEEVGRIGLDGMSSRWHFSASALAVADDAVWFAPDTLPGSFMRIGANGQEQRYRFAPTQNVADITSLTAGPDGNLWFTLASYGRGPSAIGQLHRDGTVRTWPLRRRAAPGGIAAGPDGALWFTEQTAARIGRVTTEGRISEFRLGGLVPGAVLGGRDGAVWFTAESCLGRLTTDGAIATWPIKGAKTLKGIVATHGGTLWLADNTIGALFRVAPPSGNIEPTRRCGPPTLVRRAGSTRARLTYWRLDAFRGVDWFTDARIAIARNGRVLLRERIPTATQGRANDYGAYADADDILVRDLDRDGEPEVIVSLNWNGTHCCWWERVYRYDRGYHTYVPVNHFWGNGGPPQLKDLGRDGRWEFVYNDDRFAEDFCGYAGSVRPIQIWSYGRGSFRNVTKSYPALIARDARSIWRLYLKYRRQKDRCVQGILPAWAADEYMLGRGQTVWPALEQARREGYLTARYENPGGMAYIRAVRGLLRRTGYLSG